MKRFKKPTNKFPLKTFTIGLLTAVTVLHLFEKRYITMSHSLKPLRLLIGYAPVAMNKELTFI
jgi:hypothetical protein